MEETFGTGSEDTSGKNMKMPLLVFNDMTENCCADAGSSPFSGYLISSLMIYCSEGLLLQTETEETTIHK